MEAHNGLSSLLVENLKEKRDNRMFEFDAMWLSSLTDSTAKGRPDIELVDRTSRLQTINEILEITTKPIIYDADTGGITEHFVYLIKSLERLGGICRGYRRQSRVEEEFFIWNRSSSNTR